MMWFSRRKARRVAAILAVAGIVAGSTTLINRPVGETLAAWTDQQSAQATVKMAWSTGGFAKNTANSYTNFNSYPSRDVDATSVRSFSQPSPASGATVARSYGQSGNQNLDGVLAPNFEIWTAAGRYATRVDSCVEAAAPLQLASTSGNGSTNCNYPSGSTSMTRASSSGPSDQGFGKSGFYANPSANIGDRILIVEAAGIQTSAECHSDGTTNAQPPKATWWGGSNNRIGVLTTDSIVAVLRQFPDSSYKLVTPAPNSVVRGWIQPKLRTGLGTGRDEDGSVWVYYKIQSRNFTAPGYALSDMTIQVAHYNPSTKNRVGTSELLLGRSECGVYTPTNPTISPLANTWMSTNDIPASVPNGVSEGVTSTLPAPVPNPVTGIEVVPSGLRAMLQKAVDALSSPLSEPSATTTTTPTAEITASETTTSAPPEPGDDASTTSGESIPSKTDEITTSPVSSTSARAGEESTSDVMGDGGSETASSEPSASTKSTAPTTTAPSTAPTVPDVPGQMPANAEFCESLKVDGEYVDAFTADECDAAARISAMSALEDYIADGEQDSRWKGFTSDDPEADGWRWAAIDQRTGHIVYVP